MALNNATVEYVYDTEGRRTQEKDLLDRWTKTEYDTNGRVQAVVMNYINDTVEGADDDLRFEFEYDTDGRQTLIRKPSGAEIEKVYNADGQLQYEFGPVNANDDNGPGLNRRMVTEYEYDTNGRIKAEWKGTAAADKSGVVRQQRVEYTYDQTWHAVAEKKFFAGATLERWEKYTYGADYGDLVKVETFDGSGNKTRTVTYEHDGVTGQLVGTNSPEGQIEYGYDARGRLTRIRTSTGIDTKYTYDEYGRMKTIGDDGIGGEIKYSYDAFGRKNRIDRPNGTYTEYTYNNTLGAVESILHKAADDSTQLGLAYTRNDEGIITAIEETRDGGTHTWTYGFDGLDRLTSAVLSDGTSNEYDYQYSYDRNGNRLSKSVTVNEGTAVVSNYTYNALDQLTLTTEGTDSTEYTYDSIGRLITEKLNSTTTRNYTWSVDDHLLSVGLPQEAGSPVINYSYDHEGRRVARWEDGVGKQFLQDNNNPTGYSQTLAESSGDGTQVEANYYYGDSFGPMVQAYNPESPEFDLQFLLGDHLSTTRGLTDASGTYNGLTYSPFGDILAGNSSLTNYAFTGQWKDATSGLQHHRARWLDTGVGRWASTDPVFDFPGNFGSAYGYVTKSPLVRVDPDGTMGVLMEVVLTAAIIGGLSGLSMGVEGALSDKPGTSFAKGFKEGFAWGFGITLGIALIIAAIAYFAPWLFLTGAIYASIYGVILLKIVIALGIIGGVFGVHQAIQEGEYKVAAWRGLQTIFGVASGLSAVREATLRLGTIPSSTSIKAAPAIATVRAKPIERLVYRGTKSSVKPGTVFTEGDPAKGGMIDLLEHLKGTKRDSYFKSTSPEWDVAHDFANKNGYVYVIRTKRGIDANVHFGDLSPFPEQYELSIPGGIFPEEVVGAFSLNNKKEVIEWIPNPNYVDFVPEPPVQVGTQ